ncbi:MAG: hypothetical protein MRZ79_02940 [Bacteroidia bacterium]|nr:hypothetical protein [Bacteroidia bacterium]
MLRLLMCTVLCIGMSWNLFAQVPVRPDDHFFRKRIVNRISLVEKINRPLVHHESNLYTDNQKFSEQEGMVASLINGLKAGKYQAYDPYDWKKTLNYQELESKMKEYDSALDMKLEGEEEEEDWESDFETKDEVFGAGEEEVWEDDASGDNDWNDEWEEDVIEEDDEEKDRPYKADLAPYEEVIHMVEDRIFDKNRSMMVNQIDFFEVIWVDPSGILPEKVLARFKWEDVKDQLQLTKWKTRANDASSLSIAQALEMRMFHSFLINVGGQGVRSLWEAEKRRQDLVEFEHHLWSY